MREEAFNYMYTLRNDLALLEIVKETWPLQKENTAMEALYKIQLPQVLKDVVLFFHKLPPPGPEMASYAISRILDLKVLDELVTHRKLSESTQREILCHVAKGLDMALYKDADISPYPDLEEALAEMRQKREKLNFPVHSFNGSSKGSRHVAFHPCLEQQEPE